MPDQDTLGSLYPTMKAPDGLTKHELREMSRKEIERRVNTAPSLAELQKELPKVFNTETDQVLAEAASRYDPEKEELLGQLYTETDFSACRGEIGKVFPDIR